MRTIWIALATLLPFALPAQQQGTDAKAEYKTLDTDFRRAVAKWRQDIAKQVAEAQARGESPAISMVPPTKEFIDRALALADKYKGTDDAVPFLAFAATRASNEADVAKKAAQTLIDQHAGSAAISDFVDVLPHMGEHLFGAEGLEKVLDRILKTNQDPELQAKALFVRGSWGLKRATDDTAREAAKQALAKVAALSKNQELVAQAKAVVFELENLQVGCKAPEIEGKDTDGVAFKLSDYRGKVVLLDFWGFW